MKPLPRTLRFDKPGCICNFVPAPVCVCVCVCVPVCVPESGRLSGTHTGTGTDLSAWARTYLPPFIEKVLPRTA